MKPATFIRSQGKGRFIELDVDGSTGTLLETKKRIKRKSLTPIGLENLRRDYNTSWHRRKDTNYDPGSHRAEFLGELAKIAGDEGASHVQLHPTPIAAFPT